MEILALFPKEAVNPWLVWICVGVTCMVAFGWKFLKKICAWNKAHHAISFEDDVTLDYDDEEEYDSRNTLL